MTFFLQRKSNTVQKVCPKAFAEVPSNELILQVALLSPSVQSILNQLHAVSGVGTVHRVFHHMKPTSNCFSSNVLGHYLAVGLTPDRPCSPPLLLAFFPHNSDSNVQCLTVIRLW